ncbi:MAG: HAD-IC family P-type ATPase, partial [Coxiellaceae bacterium]|nr:HAD-IC family P-type ATPase [Coxiellaceae bacterium]
LIRHLPAVEALGSVTVICSDKTGTLTKNQMQVDLIYADNTQWTRIPQQNEVCELWRLLIANLLLNNKVVFSADGQLLGEPTEEALVNYGLKSGQKIELLQEAMPKIAEIPFTSERKLMTTIHRANAHCILFSKGAPEIVLPLCDQHQMIDGCHAIDRQKILIQAAKFAEHGYRVIAFAYRYETDYLSKDTTNSTDLERHFVFLGLAALIDLPRDEVPDAIFQCQQAGIRPIMITGDHPDTAMAIAKKLAITNDECDRVTGVQLAGMTSQALQQSVNHVAVYARTTPDQKIRIIDALEANHEFVAMTGDGVNDAPALKRAPVGIAMNLKGTDVAREAADAILLDDNFATIVAAVSEGRHILDNILKFVKYTMTSNFGEIFILLFAPLLGMPLPLMPIQILWVNLMTDGLPGLAYAAEPKEIDIMRRPPRPPAEQILNKGFVWHMLLVGSLIGGISLFSQWLFYQSGSLHWQTIVFTVLTFTQLANAMAIRSDKQSIVKLGLFSNLIMLGAIALSVILQLTIIYMPWLQVLFHTTPLTYVELGFCALIALLVLLIIETVKLVWSTVNKV